MDNKLFNLKNNNNLILSKISTKELQDLVEKNMSTLLGLQLLESNYMLDRSTNDYIQTLAIDSDRRLVIIEYREGKFSRVINKALVQIDYIKDHLSIFKLLCHDKFGDNNKYINYNARLIVIGESFHKTDGDTIRKLPYDIDLIKYDIFDKDYLLLNKTYTSRNINLANFDAEISKREQEIIGDLINYVLSLGEEISITYFENVISFRKIKTFMTLGIGSQLALTLLDGNRTYILKDLKDIENIEKDIEDNYDLL